MSVMSADTIVYNASRISEWQQMDDFDYNRETVESQTSILQWLLTQLLEFFNELLHQALNLEQTYWIFIAVIVVLLAVAVWVIYRTKPALFGWRKKDQMDYELEEDNIYGIDFDAELHKALERKNYREAVRLKYLQTLKLLTERERIDWQLHKTPTQYTLEFDDAQFRQMTNHFLRIRYGYFEATEEIYHEVAELYAALAKGGEA
ncbi:MAG: DUF4129 domain-containing protein [Prevotella sp.]|nr:DUF4129 domain-containing protein [Prevotella sp.]